MSCHRGKGAWARIVGAVFGCEAVCMQVAAGAPAVQQLSTQRERRRANQEFLALPQMHPRRNWPRPKSGVSNSTPVIAHRLRVAEIRLAAPCASFALLPPPFEV